MIQNMATWGIFFASVFNNFGNRTITPVRIFFDSIREALKKFWYTSGIQFLFFQYFFLIKSQLRLKGAFFFENWANVFFGRTSIFSLLRARLIINLWRPQKNDSSELILVHPSKLLWLLSKMFYFCMVQISAEKSIFILIDSLWRNRSWSRIWQLGGYFSRLYSTILKIER